MFKKEYLPKPMMFYVTTISETDAEHFGVDVEMSIDVQLTERDTKKLINMLQSKINVEVYGTVSFRLKGRLIL